MNNEGWLILLIPLLGLVPIVRGGRFRWKVVPFSAALIRYQLPAYGQLPTAFAGR
jgi:hypothetical protein